MIIQLFGLLKVTKYLLTYATLISFLCLLTPASNDLQPTIGALSWKAAGVSMLALSYHRSEFNGGGDEGFDVPLISTGMCFMYMSGTTTAVAMIARRRAKAIPEMEETTTVVETMMIYCEMIPI